MKIHEIQQQGTGNSLGPVKVNKSYGVRGAGQKTSQFLLIEDDSGKGAITIWGPAASTQINEGDLITITASGPNGKLENQEYPAGSNKWSINANSCRVTVQGHGGGQQAAQQTQQPAQQPARQYGGGGGGQQQETGISTAEMASRAAAFAQAYVGELQAIGCPDDIAWTAAARHAPSWAAEWWFGAKHPGKPAGE